MTRHRPILTAIAIVIGLACLIIIGMPYAVHIKPKLSAQEQQLARYQYEKVEIKERMERVVSGLRNPMTDSFSSPGKAGQGGYPGEKLADLAPPAGGGQDPAVRQQPGVSFIVIKDRNRMAIVNGEVVREGDRTGHGKIVRITKAGVLIKNQEGQQWVYIE